MAKKISLFKKVEPLVLEEDVSFALREMAGWPVQTHHQHASRNRHRTVVIHRDSHGRIIGSVEQIDEDESEDFSDSYGR